MKLILLLGSTLFASGMQMPTTPPLKMGLWESTTVMNITLPPGVPSFMGGGPRTVVAHSCFTPESWAKNVNSSQQQKNCVRSNEVYTATSFTFDLSCNNGKSTGHFQMTFDSMETAHGTMHQDSGPKGITIDSTTNTHFVSSDCGAVTPDKPVIVK